MSLSSDTEDFGMAGLGREHARHALLARYARGRVSHFLFRQILTALGAAVLFTMNGPVSGTWALVLALLGEAIDCLFLWGSRNG